MMIDSHLLDRGACFGLTGSLSLLCMPVVGTGCGLFSSGAGVELYLSRSIFMSTSGTSDATDGVVTNGVACSPGSGVDCLSKECVALRASDDSARSATTSSFFFRYPELTRSLQHQTEQPLPRQSRADTSAA